MGRQIDLDSPLSDEDKQYLKDRGRGYLIPANERRFGKDGTREPEPWEKGGGSAQSPFYDNQERAKAVYDVGGAPLPGVVLNKDTGRVMDRENGVQVEFTGPGHVASGYDFRNQSSYGAEGFNEMTEDEYGRPIVNEVEDFDEDIVDYVKSLQNKDEVQAELKEYEVSFGKEEKRESLNDKLIIAYQDMRKNGADISFVESEEESNETE